MNKIAISILTILAATGCAGPAEVPEGKIVPIRALLSEMRDKPYECYEYSARTDRCKGIVTRRLSGDKVIMVASLQQFLRGGGSAAVQLKVSFDIEGHAYCGSLSDAELSMESGIIPAPIQAEILADVRRRMSDEPRLCNEYIRDAEGRIYSLSRDQNGRIDGSVDRVWFFAERKALSG